MQHVRYKGQQPTVFHGVGEVQVGQVIWVPDHTAEALVNRGEFEIVKSTPKKSESSKLDVDKNAKTGDTSKS